MYSPRLIRAEAVHKRHRTSTTRAPRLAPRRIARENRVSEPSPNPAAAPLSDHPAPHAAEPQSSATKPPPAKAPITYADAGVDITSGDRAKQRIKMLARKTFNKHVLSEIGGFGGLFALDLEKFPQPVLVSSADGVGTKLKVAFELGIHHTVGADLVNHCVNDIAVQGATPLFFLDYLATGKLREQDSATVETVVRGLSEACRANGCALIGGETAQMPGFYADGEYDLAGTIVGCVNRPDIITGENIEIGDVLIGLPSNGLHTNGYSLARKLLFEVARYGPDQYVNELKDKTGAALMRTHRSYLGVIKKLTAPRRPRPRHGPHHRRRHYGEPAPHPAPRHRRHRRPRQLDRPAPLRAPAAARQRRPGRDAAHLQHGHRPDRRSCPPSRSRRPKPSSTAPTSATASSAASPAATAGSPTTSGLHFPLLQGYVHGCTSEDSVDFDSRGLRAFCYVRYHWERSLRDWSPRGGHTRHAR